MKFGDIIKKLRKKRRMTQSELADACMISEKTIQRLEKNKNVNSDTLQGIYSVFNEPDEQALLNQIDNEQSVNELKDKDTLILHEVKDANTILNSICTGWIRFENGRPVESRDNGYIAFAYQNHNRNEVLDKMKECMDMILQYRKEYSSTLHNSIGPDPEFHNYNFADDINELKMKTSFTLNKVINDLKRISFSEQIISGYDNFGEPDGFHYENHEYSINIFINSNGWVLPKNSNDTIDPDECPIIYMCDSTHKGISQKNKDSKILRLDKSIVLPNHAPFDTYTSFK